MRSSRRQWGFALMTAAPALVVYTLTACRDIAWMDSVEFALSSAVFGVPHPTGYPLYSLAIRLAGATGFGPAFGPSLFSGLAAAAACGVCAIVGLRIGLRPEAALTGALSLAFSREVLAQATVPEVYSLHLLIVALLLLVALDSTSERDPSRSLLVLAYLFGLGLAHHLTVVFILPALLVIITARGWRRLTRLGLPTAAAMAVVIGIALTLYGVLPLRSLADPILDQGDPETPGRLLAHITGRQFSYRLLTSETTYVTGELARFFRQLPHQWTPIHLAAAVIGLGALFRRRERRRLAVALVLLVTAVVAHAVEYRIPDKSAYFLPAYLALALLIAAGADAVIGFVRRWPGRSAQAFAGLAPLALVIVLPLASAIAHVSENDRHGDHSLRDLTIEVVRRTSPGSLIVNDDMSLAFSILYLQLVDGLFRDREVVMQYLLPLPWYAERLAKLDPLLPAEVRSRAARRQGLEGRALGDRTAADARELAAALAERARTKRDVFLYFHDFEIDRRSFENLALADRGLVYQVVDREATRQPSIPGATFARLSAYEAAHRHTRYERMVARRFAAASNRAGIAHVNLGDFATAEAEFRQAIALEPEYAQAWFNLGILAADYLGRRDEAIEAWRTFLSLSPESPDAPAVRARLSQLAAANPREAARSRPVITDSTGLLDSPRAGP